MVRLRQRISEKRTRQYCSQAHVIESRERSKSERGDRDKHQITLLRNRYSKESEIQKPFLVLQHHISSRFAPPINDVHLPLDYELQSQELQW